MSVDALRAVEAELATRWPESKLEPSLDRIRDLTDLLGRPQDAYPVIHISGTNGKTSTARMIDELLRELGLRTGRFTSPHLVSVTERICLDGEPIDGDRFAAGYRELAPYLDLVDSRHDVRLSYFEVLVALAYATFADAPVDVAVVEVGMGGVWDATNVADGKIAVITPIAIDHADYLGDTIEQIAEEKAGIIKAGSVVVVGQQPDEAAEVLARRSAEVGATVVVEDGNFAVRDRQLALGGQQLALRGLTGDYDDVMLPLHGWHQASNAACAVAAVEAFVGGAREPIDTEVVRNALARVGSPGRLEVLRRGPTILVDAAHNPAGARALSEAIQDEFSFTKLVGVVAVLSDKDVRGILEELEPIMETIVVTENSSPRRLPVAELTAVAEQVFGAERTVPAANLPDAIDTAMSLVEQDAIFGGAGVLVTGSVVTAGDARHLLGGPQ
ncbi:MAG TPA: folylpolyglutamate synthase/dihydrofolate synthase family protein [Jiangellaceae bacterium]